MADNNQQRIFDFYDRLPAAVDANTPPELVRFIELRDEMVRQQQRENEALHAFPMPDTQGIHAAQNAYDAAGEEFFSRAETLIAEGRLDSLITFVRDQQPPGTLTPDEQRNVNAVRVNLPTEITPGMPAEVARLVELNNAARALSTQINEQYQPTSWDMTGASAFTVDTSAVATLQEQRAAADNAFNIYAQELLRDNKFQAAANWVEENREKGWGEWAWGGVTATGSYIAALPEVAWNNPGVLLQSAENLVGSTIGLGGDLLDLADVGTRYAGWGSLKEGIGLDSNTRYGEVVRSNVVGALDYVTGTPTIREGSNDQLVMDGTEIVGDLALIVASGGTAGIAKGAVRTAAGVVRHSVDDIAEATVRATADDAARLTARATIDDAAEATVRTTMTTVPPLDMAALTAAARPLIDNAERSIMGIRDFLVRRATSALDDAVRAVDDVAPAAARAADDVAPVAARAASVADDVAPAALAATQTVNAAAIGQSLVSGFRAAASGIGSYLGGATPRWVSLGAITGYFGIKIAEHETGGALSEAAFDASVGLIRAGVQSGAITRENLEDRINNAAYILQVNNSFDKAAQNLYVRSIVGENPTPEDIANGQAAAISWQMLPSNIMLLGAKHATRLAVVDDVYTDRNEADRHLAQGLIDDIVSNAQVRSLDGHQVTQDHVRDIMREVMQNPEKHPQLNSLLTSQGGRLHNGMLQIWPELATPAADPAAANPTWWGSQTPEEETPAAPSVPETPAAIGDRWKSHLDNIASNLQNIPGLSWLAPIIGLLSALIGAITDLFKGNDVQAQSDNPERLAALGRTMGQDGAVIPRIDHNGQNTTPVTVDADHRRQPLPGQTLDMAPQ